MTRIGSQSTPEKTVDDPLHSIGSRCDSIAIFERAERTTNPRGSLAKKFTQVAGRVSALETVQWHYGVASSSQTNAKRSIFETMAWPWNAANFAENAELY